MTKRATIKTGVVIPLNRFSPPQRQFMQWLQKFNPKLFNEAMKSAQIAAGQQLNEYDQIGDWGDIFTAVADTVKSAAPAVLQYQQQKKLLELQLKRAKEGQPPISSGDYAQYATMTTGASAEAGGQPYIVDTYVGGMRVADIVKYGAFALLAIGGIYFLTRKRR